MTDTNSTSTFKEKLDFRSYKSSGDIKVPDRMIDQIIGQEEAVETIIKAAKQKKECSFDWGAWNR